MYHGFQKNIKKHNYLSVTSTWCLLFFFFCSYVIQICFSHKRHKPHEQHKPHGIFFLFQFVPLPYVVLNQIFLQCNHSLNSHNRIHPTFKKSKFQFIFYSVSIYSPSCCSKPLCVYLFFLFRRLSKWQQYPHFQRKSSFIVFRPGQLFVCFGGQQKGKAVSKTEDGPPDCGCHWLGISGPRRAVLF